MEKFLNKLSEYHFIQTLVPGIIFTYFSNLFYKVSFLTANPLYDFITILIIGLIISRIGSLFVESILKKMKITNFTNYSDYIEASFKDPLIKNLSETNNLYRAIIASFLVLLIEKWYLFLASKIPVLNDWLYLILFVLIIAIFIFAYRKQTYYIKKRIDKALNENS